MILIMDRELGGQSQINELKSEARKLRSAECDEPHLLIQERDSSTGFFVPDGKA